MNPATLTLRTFYEQAFLALIAGVRKRTLDEYRFTLNAWERFAGEMPLDRITPLTLAEFKASLDGKVSPHTINKHLRHLNAVIAKAGPPGPRNRDAMNVINSTPWTRPIRTERTTPRVFTFDELNALYAAAGVARFPRIEDVPPQSYWEALLVFAFNTGFRRGAIHAIAFADVSLIERTAALPARFDKARTPRLKPFNQVVLRHLLRVRTNRERLFPWPHSARDFYNTWHALQVAAGVAGDKGPFRKFHDFKRTCGTHLARVASAWAVRYMLDHAQQDVTGQHYISPLDELRDAVERLPQPSRFTHDAQEQHA